MKRIIIFIFIILLPIICLASSNQTYTNWTILAPPKQLDTLATYNYLYTLYSHFNQIQRTTLDPNGNIIGLVGKTILYNNGATDKLCVETTVPTGSVWKCTILS